MVAAHRCPVALHPADREQLVSMRFLPGIPADTPDVDVDEDLADGQVIAWHGLDIGVIHTPGHTRGSVCFMLGTDLVSGDTLFHRGVGRADLPGGNWQQLMVSIEQRLYTLAAGRRGAPGPRAEHHHRRRRWRRTPSWSTRATAEALSPPTRSMRPISSLTMAAVTPHTTLPSSS